MIRVIAPEVHDGSGARPRPMGFEDAVGKEGRAERIRADDQQSGPRRHQYRAARPDQLEYQCPQR